MQKYKKTLELDDFLPESRLVIDEYYCTLCKGIYMHPTVDDCGHVYCRDCLFKYMETSSSCPVSNNMLDRSKITSIKFIANILDKQSVYCKKRKLGCQWIGKLSDLEPHLKNDCLKNEVKCRNIDCKKEILREEEESHFLVCEHKRVPCKDCGSEILLVDQTNHSKLCPKFKVECYQQCGEFVERGELEFHAKNVCENSVVQCIYYAQGCKENVLKKNFNSHLTEYYEKHQFLIFKVFEDFDKMFNSRISALEEVYENFTKKINTLESLVSETKLKEKPHYGRKANGKVNKENISKKKEEEKEKEKRKHRRHQAKIASGELTIEETLSSGSISKGEKAEKMDKGLKNKDIKDNKDIKEIKVIKPSNNKDTSEAMRLKMEKSKEKVLMGLKRKRQETSSDSGDDEAEADQDGDKTSSIEEIKITKKQAKEKKENEKEKIIENGNKKYKIKEVKEKPRKRGRHFAKNKVTKVSCSNSSKSSSSSENEEKKPKESKEENSRESKELSISKEKDKDRDKDLKTSKDIKDKFAIKHASKLSFNPGTRVTRSQEQETKTEKEDMILDMVSSSKGITINANSAVCSANSKNEHRCVFANMILNDTEKKWQVKVVNVKNWLGIGVSLKEVVICNKFKFVYSNPLFNHGTFMISSNGISWNSNNQKENNSKIKNFPGIKIGDVITLSYKSKKSELEFHIGDFEYVMHDVVSIRAFLVPTVVFLSLGDEVMFDTCE